MQIWLLALASVTVVSLVSLVGVFTLSLSAERLNRAMFLLVAFAVGAMLGGALLHLIPRAFELIGNGPKTGALVLAGIVGFFGLEQFLHWRHHHDVPHLGDEAGGARHAHHHAPRVQPFAMMNLVGDAAHNLLDGMLIAAAYLVSIPTGLVTTAAVMLHEIPQEIGDFGVLVYGGMKPKRALLYNFLSGLFGLAGAVISLGLGATVTGYEAVLLPVTAGAFLYVAGSDLIPELHEHHSYPVSKALAQLVMIGLGVGLIALGLLFE
jgi:zinc and cadmium transporter